MVSSNTPHHAPLPVSASSSYQGDRPPATIAELAERAQRDLWDPSKDLKHWLRVGQRYRMNGKKYAEEGDLENAFVEFARAATIVLQKLPTHRDYKTQLSSPQRNNLGLNGQDILDNLSKLKPTLVERYEEWQRRYGNSVTSAIQAVEPTGGISRGQSRQDDQRREAEEPSRRQREKSRDNVPRHPREKSREDGQRVDETRRTAAMQEARRAAEHMAPPSRQYEQSGRPSAEPLSRERSRGASDEEALRARLGGMQLSRSSQQAEAYPATNGDARAVPYRSRSSQGSEEAARRQQGQQAEMLRREEDIRRKREADAQRRAERDGILQRQQEAEAASRRARRSRSPSPLPPPALQPHAASARMPEPQPVPSYAQAEDRRAQQQDGYGRWMPEAEAAQRYAREMPQPQSSGTAGLSRQNTMPAETQVRRLPVTPDLKQRQEYQRRPLGPSATASQLRPEGIAFLPLESPTKYEDDTDRESVAEERPNAFGRQQPEGKHRSRTPARSSSYPPPMTTTSPAPPEFGHVQYPTLMTHHQLKQGYSPSLQSMFAPTSGSVPLSNSSLLLGPQPSGLYPPAGGMYGNVYNQPQSASHAYNAGRPPPVPPPPLSNGRTGMGRPSSYGIEYPQPPAHSHPHQHMGPPPPPVPAPVSRIESGKREDPVKRELRTVSLPRECLPRFLAIASINTSKNKETCGLLLGKDKGQKYVVTTLLIPKQHSTSDTCTMDEEELVLQFTEERGLITLGWIHTHPSQSCFMSSVDLHTHSGFQRMLPESFAVVCAPKFTPSFGIFRLTDPPGLQTILDCTAKEAFHPHPDVPIYTDADKGHVVMKDNPLEIVDLR